MLDFRNCQSEVGHVGVFSGAGLNGIRMQNVISDPFLCVPPSNLRLFHEFLIEQRPQSSVSLVLQCFSDVRLQPAALHSCRLVLLHINANPCLRQGSGNVSWVTELGGLPWKNVAKVGSGETFVACLL